MRVLGISGSLRSGSFNSRLLGLALARLPESATVVRFTAIDAVPAYDGDREHDQPAAVGELKQLIDSVDAVLIATPEYNSSIPGALKNALDWVSRPYESNPLRGKPALVIGASDGISGAVEAQSDLRKALARIGARVVQGDLPVAFVKTMIDGEDLVLPDPLSERLNRLIGELVGQSARELSSAA